MEFDDLRPVISGLFGALASVALGHWLSRWLPEAINQKPAAVLVLENRAPIRIANGVFAIAILMGIALYQWGGFSSSDWRPLGLATGLALSAPLTIVPLVARWRGGSVREALAAYAIAQKIPPLLLYSICAAGIALLMFSIAHVVSS